MHGNNIKLKLDDCHIEGNYALEYGGGIYVKGDNVSIIGTMKNDKVTSSIKNNASKDNGAGIYIDGEGASIENIEIKNNSTSKNGGGIFLGTKHVLKLSGSVVVKDNKAGETVNNLYLGGTETPMLILKGLLMPRPVL